LRNDVGLHGPRFGCGLGQCGACTVHIVGRPTFSCILPIAAVGDREVTTLEGLLENGKPNKLQQAFIDEQAAQCGYCISGMVMRAQALLHANPHPTDDEIRKHMRPNLCRCGTHAAIMRAIKRAAAAKGETAMNPPFAPSRRELLKGTGALVVAFSLNGSGVDAIAQNLPAPKSVALDQVDTFLAIDEKGAVTVYTGKVELGTGVRTGFTQI